MPSINIPPSIFSQTTVVNAFATIGFVPKTVSETYTSPTKMYWRYDTDRLLYLNITNNGAMAKLHYSSNDKAFATILDGNSSISSSGITIFYRLFRHSVMLGYCIGSSGDFILKHCIDAPVSEQDEWLYIGVGTNYASIIRITERTTYVATNYGGGGCIFKGTFPESAIQISKAWCVNRFVDNLYFATVCPYMPLYTTLVGYVGNKKYLIWVPCTQEGIKGHNLAFDITGEE